MRKYLPLLSIIFILFGCASYVMKPPPAPAVDIRSSYEQKIAGKWAVVVDKSTTVFEREISSTGSMSPFDHPPVCHAYDFPFSSGNTISISVNKTLPEVFDEIVAYKNKPKNWITYKKIIVRSLKLIGLGLFLALFLPYLPFIKDLEVLRFPGVLQQFGCGTFC